MTENEQQQGRTDRGCPFPDCDWSVNPEMAAVMDDMSLDFKTERHYEREHAGRIRVQVTLESEQMLGDRDPKEIRENVLERYEDKPLMDVAYVRTEVVEEADDHSKIERSTAQEDST